MLTRNELETFGPPGFHLAQKEKDYVQHYILSFFSRTGFGGVFKGGTCLQKVYGLPRFSEDLDFTLNSAKKPDFEALSAFLSSAGFSGLSWKHNNFEISDNAKLRFQGPLYNGSQVSEGSVLIQMSKREKTILEPQAVITTPPYSEILPYSLKVMDKQEITAEKIRTILTRFSARDLFDLYFLLYQKTKLNKQIIRRKLEYYGLSFDFGLFEEKIKKLKPIWKKEISAFSPSTLDYETASNMVILAVKKQV